MINNKGHAIISLSWGVNQTLGMEEQVRNALSFVSGIAPNLIVSEVVETGVIASREDHMLSQNMVIAASDHMLLDEIREILERYGEGADADGVLEHILETDEVDGASMNFLLITPDKDPQTFEELDELLLTAEDPTEFEAVYLPKGFMHLSERKDILEAQFRDILITNLHFAIHNYFEEQNLLGIISLPTSVSIGYMEDSSAYTHRSTIKVIDLLFQEESTLNLETRQYDKDFSGYDEHDIEDMPNQARSLVHFIKKYVDPMELRLFVGDHQALDVAIFDKIAQHHST